MSNNQKTILFTAAVLILVGVTALVIAIGMEDSSRNEVRDRRGQFSQERPDKKVEPIKSTDGIELETNYLGDNIWEYKVSGMKPTPCHTVNTDVFVMESFPERVVINLSIEYPETDIACAQVLEPFEIEGELKVSEGATIKLKVLK